MQGWCVTVSLCIPSEHIVTVTQPSFATSRLFPPCQAVWLQGAGKSVQSSLQDSEEKNKECARSMKHRISTTAAVQQQQLLNNSLYIYYLFMLKVAKEPGPKKKSCIVQRSGVETWCMPVWFVKPFYSSSVSQISHISLFFFFVLWNAEFPILPFTEGIFMWFLLCRLVLCVCSMELAALWPRQLHKCQLSVPSYLHRGALPRRLLLPFGKLRAHTMSTWSLLQHFRYFDR